ncbi:hypothetical protein GF351_04670 [Candidatus Woesearchaeota archaeon]|nr:hypothetical protein [Candidatus Woesearchaeota archaeon]
MILLLLLVPTLEKEVEEEIEKETAKESQENIEEELEPVREKAKQKKTLKERYNAFVNNAANVVNNAFANTAGYAIAKYQNFRSKRNLKKDNDKDIVYLMHGSFQNEGSQWRLAKELKKEGYVPYHLKGNHHLDRKGSAQEAYKQVEKLHEKADVENASERNDYFSGHSSGADTGLYMATGKEAKKHGIKAVQARAPAPYGIKGRTFWQKALMPLAKKDNIKDVTTQREVSEFYRKKPAVDVHVLAGKYDALVPPEDAVYKGASSFKVIDHPDSTHFGTSGVNKEMNEMFVDELGNYRTKESKKAA